MDFNYDTGTIDTVSILDTTEASPLLGGVTGVLYVLGTGALSLPFGSTGQQPVPAIGGMLRYNVGGFLEYYNSTVPTWQTLSTGGGSVTSITVTTGTGMQVSGGSSQTISTNGTFALTLSSTLQSLSSLASNGILVNNGGTISASTITGTAGNITVTNGNGVAGNPTINLATVTQGSTGTSFVKVALDGFGRVVDNTPVTQSDLTTVIGTYYLPESGGTMSGAINMGGNQINNMSMASTPASTDATTVGYVQSLLSGLSWKEAVSAATTAPLSAVTYNNGSAGVGATLTDTSAGTVLVVDGYTAQLNDRILVKNQANPIQNGIYYVSTLGVAGTTPYVLTRTTDTNTGAQLFGATVYVDQGTTNANTGWTQTTTGTLTIGTSNITWAQFSGSGAYTAGTGISIVGTTISNTGVLSFQTSLSGLTPSTATNGVVTLAGTLGIASGGTGQTSASSAFGALSPLTTNGDILYFNTTNARLPIGTTGQILQVVGGEPTWTTLSSSAVTSITGTAFEITASASVGAVTLSIPSQFIAPGSVQVTTSLQTSASVTVTAAGSNQGTATQLTSDYNVVTTTPASTGVILPASLAGNKVTVVNVGANALLVYPPVGAAIDGLSVNIPVSVPVGQAYDVTGATSTQLYTVQPTFSAGAGLSFSDGNGLATFANTGVLSISGTANQITASASTGNITLSLPSSVSIASLTLTGATANSFLYSGTGGLLTTTAAPTNGQLLIGSTGAAPVAANITTSGAGISVTNGAGTITLANTGVTSIVAGTAISISGATGAVTINNTGVTSFSASTTGLTPATPTTGAIVLGGTLVVGNGGTGGTTFTTNGVIYGAGTSPLGVTAAGTTGQILVGNTGTAPSWATASSTVVTSFQTSLSGLTPSTATTGAVTLAGTLNSTSGGTGTGTAPTAGQVLVGTTGGQYVPFTITTGTGISTTTGSGTLQINNTGVTSNVAGTGISVSGATGAVTINNTGVLSVSFNDTSTTPIFTTSPTAATTGAVAETMTLVNQTAHTVLIGPSSGGAAQPTFRTLAYSDVVGTALKLYAENPSSPVAPSTTGANSIAIGSAAVSSQYGGLEHAAGEFSTAGDAQHGTFVLRNQTTNATQTHLFLDGASLEYVVPVNTVVSFNIMIAAINNAVTGAGGGWKFEGVIYRGATVSTTAFIGTPAETTLGRTGGFNATVTVAASASTGALAIEVTGLASTTINWVATLETTEVGAS